MYVTVSTYTNLALTRGSTGSSPMFFGLMFIHGQSDTDTYNRFFSRLTSKLQDMDFHQLRLGLDDEYAMRKSLSFCFRGAALLACTRHLQQNTESCSGELAGVTSSLKHRFMHAVFGDRGLASCTDVAQFDCTVDRLRDGLLTEVPDHVQSYFNNRCV